MSYYHRERTHSALQAVSRFMRTRPFNYQISSEFAHLTPKFTDNDYYQDLTPVGKAADLK